MYVTHFESISVDNEQFKAYSASLCGRTTVPSESHIRQTMMPRIYLNVKQKVNKLLGELSEFCSVTTDMWTSSNVDAYMAITVHFISRDSWERKIVVLECLPFPEKHTAKNISRVLRRVLDEYKLSKKLHLVVRDNAINVVKAMEIGKYEHVGCFLHALHLVVEKNLSSQSSIKQILRKVNIF